MKVKIIAFMILFCFVTVGYGENEGGIYNTLAINPAVYTLSGHYETYQCDFCTKDYMIWIQDDDFIYSQDCRYTSSNTGTVNFWGITSSQELQYTRTIKACSSCGALFKEDFENLKKNVDEIFQIWTDKQILKVQKERDKQKKIREEKAKIQGKIDKLQNKINQLQNQSQSIE